MKKLLSIGLLTVCALAISETTADAWVNSRFSIGLNWHHQSANTSYLWGLWRNGQIPGPEAVAPMPPPGAPQPFPFLGAQSGAPAPHAFANPQGGYPQGAYAQAFYPQVPYGYYAPAYGMPGAAQGYPQGMLVAYPQPAPQNFETAPPPLLNVAQQYPFSPNMTWNANPFQAVSYQPNYYGYAPNYYFPAYGYEAPYYWYNNRR